LPTSSQVLRCPALLSSFSKFRLSAMIASQSFVSLSVGQLSCIPGVFIRLLYPCPSAPYPLSILFIHPYFILLSLLLSFSFSSSTFNST
jgi:hypothetical protein